MSDIQSPSDRFRTSHKEFAGLSGLSVAQAVHQDESPRVGRRYFEGPLIGQSFLAFILRSIKYLNIARDCEKS